MSRIADSRVVITGAASGIGRLLALKMAARGARLALWDLNAAALEKVLAEVKPITGRDAHGAVVDVSDRHAVAIAARDAVAAIGPIDILVNNAGVVSGQLLLDIPDEKIETTFRVNVLALYWTTRAFLPAMIARNGGHIVTMASAAGLVGAAHITDYAASKHAAVGFNEALRLELRKLAPGVKTTIVCPFYIDTGMFAGVKTRIPLLLPILKEEKVAGRIVRAVQLNHAQIQMPLLVRTIPLMRLLPVPVFDQIAQLLGVTECMADFTGRACAPEAPPTPAPTQD
jgi:all-trans-retinol dehydrogenase (NAD+)